MGFFDINPLFLLAYGSPLPWVRQRAGGVGLLPGRRDTVQAHGRGRRLRPSEACILLVSEGEMNKSTEDLRGRGHKIGIIGIEWLDIFMRLKDI